MESKQKFQKYWYFIVETRIILQTVKTRVHKNTYFSYQIPHFSRNIEIHIKQHKKPLSLIAYIVFIKNIGGVKVFRIIH